MENIAIRKPYVAGRFYPKEPLMLQSYLYDLAKNILHLPVHPESVIGGVVPHAGIMFSGQHAMNLIFPLKEIQYDVIVIIAPSHTGQGPAVSLDANNQWETPMGNIQADFDLQKSGLFELSFEAQQFEHSAEILVPIIQYTFGNTTPISVITMREQSYRNAVFVAAQLNAHRIQTGKKMLILSSSDFNHFESPETGKEKDDRVLRKILSFQTSEIESTTCRYRVSVCGYGPIMALMEYAQLVDQNPQACVVSRGHSGQKIPSKEVVDYISILFHKI